MPAPPALVSWALPRLEKLLPLDGESLKQMIDYTDTLSKADAATHLENLLGPSAAVFEFIAAFNSRRSDGAVDRGLSSQSRTGKKADEPTERGAAAAEKKNDQKPKQRLPPSAAGSLISDHLPNVKTKKARQPTAKQTSSPSPRASSPQTVTTNNIDDLTAAIAALELTTNPKLAGKPRKCGCNSAIHPLFTPAPNCLSCGKIICAFEGLQPCSFCGQPLLSGDEVQDMIRQLRSERGSEKMRAHNQGHQRATAGTALGGSDGAIASQLNAAKAHRDRLLTYQAENAQRSRVVDEAADFETPSARSTKWLTPAQRALALKKQARVLRELDARARPEAAFERRAMVLSLDVKRGGVVRMVDRGPEEEAQRRAQAQAEEAEEAEEEARVQAEAEADEREAAATGATGPFSNNPLLAGGGLVRPVWEPTEDREGRGEGGGATARRRRPQKQTWRRVQDDEDDARWVLGDGAQVFADEDNAVLCG